MCDEIVTRRDPVVRADGATPPAGWFATFSQNKDVGLLMSSIFEQYTWSICCHSVALLLLSFEFQISFYCTTKNDSSIWMQRWRSGYAVDVS